MIPMVIKLLFQTLISIPFIMPGLCATSAKGKGDCCLAAQNLMLTAHALGLGTCWIGFSQPLLNSTEFKTELGIPSEYIAVAPLIVGYSEISPAKVSRKPPEILVWQELNRPIGLSE
jgi:nitroreductase